MRCANRRSNTDQKTGNCAKLRASTDAWFSSSIGNFVSKCLMNRRDRGGSNDPAISLSIMSNYSREKKTNNRGLQSAIMGSMQTIEIA